MNKKQVESYIRETLTLKPEVLKGTLKENWPEEYKKHFSLFPKKLYKYVTVNDNYIDSIKENYIYLCSAKKLDDQFECKTNFSINKILNNKQVIDDKFIDAFADMISKYPGNFDKKEITELIKLCLDKDNGLNLGKVSLELDKREPSLTDEQREEMLNFFDTLMTGSWMDNNTKNTMEDLISKAYFAQEETGIGSLTENNKSQIMWEMYANHYKGMCIEYELCNSIDAMINTFPVIYGNKRKTDFLLILTGIVLDSLFFNISNGEINELNNVKDYIKLFLTKHDEWKFQKEWRLIGKSGFKFPVPKIKKIYLGKNISQEDEEKLVEIAKEKCIDLYKQQDNYESLDITYIKL